MQLLINKRKFINRTKASLAVILSLMAAINLAGCGQNSSIDYSEVSINIDESEDALRDVVIYPGSSQVESFIPQICSYAETVGILTNVYDTLTGYDKDGNVTAYAAKNWSHSEDYKTWTFELRDNNYWVDVNGSIAGKVTAYDFVTGIEWSLNPAKTYNYSSYIPATFIKGAEEYHDYLDTLSTDECINMGNEKILEMTGISVPDENTLIIELDFNCNYFESVLGYSSFSPLPCEYIKEVGAEKYQNSAYDEILSCGPYIITDYVENNQLILDANPCWWGNEDNTRFMSVTYKLLSDNAMLTQLYKNNEINEIILSRSQASKILNDPENEYHNKVTTFEDKANAYLIYNFNKKFKDGSLDENWNRAIANENFRKALYYGICSDELLGVVNIADPYGVEATTITSPGISRFTDGTDYTEAVENLCDIKEFTGTSTRKFDEKKAEYYKEKAVNELSEEGVTFPVDLEIYASAENADTMRIVKKIITRNLDNDFINVKLKTFTGNYTTSVDSKSLQSIVLSGWASDYGDPTGTLGSFAIGDDSAYLAQSCTHLNDLYNDCQDYQKEIRDDFTAFKKMLDDAELINDPDERLYLVADAEARLINKGYLYPLYSYKKIMLSQLDMDSKISSFSAVQAMRLVNIKSNKNGYIRQKR